MDKQAREKALAKVRKCLALGQSSNSHEAETAMRQARKLMDRFQLDQVDVLASNIEEHSMPVSTSSRMPPRWIRMLSQVVAEAFGCIYITTHHFKSGCHIVFIGPIGAGEMAAYAYGVLSRQLATNKKQFQLQLPERGVGFKRRMGTHYAEHWIDAVRQKVNTFAGMDEGTEEAVNAYMGKEYPDLGYPKPQRRKKATREELVAMMAGADDGKKATLHVPMGADKQVLLEAE